MTRGLLDSGSRTEVSSQVVRELLFIRIPFTSGTLAITSGDKDYSFTPAGEGTPVTFTHGAIGGLDNLNENMNVQAERMTITLSGCDASLISAVAGTNIHWLRTEIWLGYVDSSHTLVTTPPFLLFDGFLGSATLNTAKNGSALAITAETMNAALSRYSQVRACDADQQARFSTDTLFHQCGVNPQRSIVFGNDQGTMPGNEGGHGFTDPNPVVPPAPHTPIMPGPVTDIL